MLAGGQGHKKNHFRLPMTTPDFHSLIEILRSHSNLANPRFKRLIVSQFLDFCQLLRTNFSYLPRLSKLRTNETAEFGANE